MCPSVCQSVCQCDSSFVTPGVGMCQSVCQVRRHSVTVHVILCQYVCQPMCQSVSVSSCVSPCVRLCQSVSARQCGVRQASGRAGMLAEGQPRADKSVSRLMARENSSPGCFLSQQSQ